MKATRTLGLTMQYQTSDLTVIIPTIKSRKRLLEKLIKHLQKTKISNIIIVWDCGSTPPNLKHTFKNLTIVSHTKNRGLSAARNSGLNRLETKLGMFIDDDIIPDFNFVDKIVSFHNRHPEKMTTTLSQVTWRDTEFENAITTWFEEFGNWSMFSTTHPGSIMPIFSGGFTSFKRDGFISIRFNEKFTRYGCEDIEFGQRFFKLGGKQVYLPELQGLHYKKLTISSFSQDCIGSGYSNYVYFKLWPNDHQCIGTMKASFSTNMSIDDCKDSIVKISQFERNSINSDVIAPVISYISNVSGVTGFRKALLEDFPDIKIQPNLCFEENLSQIIDKNNLCKPALLLLAIEFPKNKRVRKYWQKHKSVWAILKAVLLSHCDNSNELQDAIESVFIASSPRIQLDIKQSLVDSRGQIVSPLIESYPVSLKPARYDIRLLYSLAEHHIKHNKYDDALKIAMDILTQQPNHVGAWLIAAQLSENILTKRFFLSNAEKYLKFRPLTEQNYREKEISRLNKELNSGKKN